jgi:hypothetical protein
MSEPHERFRESLRGLAESAAGEPPLNGPELRRRAERRRRRRLLAVPTLALSGLLVGGTALAVAGAFGPEPRRVPPVSGGLPSASVPGTASASPTPGRPTIPSRSATPSTAGGPAAPTTADPAAPTTRPSASGATPVPVPGGAAVCAAARAGETLVRLDVLQLPAGLAPGVDALLSAVPVSCVRGQLEPDGPAQWLPVSPGAEVTTTTPLSAGTQPTVSTLTALATGLTQHPDQLFGIIRDARGTVIRLDEVHP